jgi:hypothetical protein
MTLIQWEQGGNVPEIPRSIDATPVDRPKMAPGEASQGEASVAALGAQMEQTAFYGAHVEEILQNAQDRVDASHLDAKYRDLFKAKEEGLDKVSYRDYPKYAQESIDDITKEFQNDPIAKDNPRLQSLVSPRFEDHSRTFQHATHLRYVKELQQDGYAQYDTEMAKYEQDASKIPAGPGRDAIFKEMDVKSQDFVKSNLLNPEIVNRRLQAREKNVQEGWVLNLTRSQNPLDIQHGIDVLNAKESTDTDKIDPEKKSILSGQAEDRLEKVKNKVDNETAMNTALGLMKDNHSDPSLALAALNADTEMQKAMGANTYQKTRQLLNDHIEDTKRQQEEVSGKISKDIMDNIKGEKLGNAQQMLDQNRDKMTKGDYEVMSNAITSEKKYIRSEGREIARDARDKRREKGDEIFGSLMTKMMNGEKFNSVKDIYSQVPKGLSSEHANLLASINDGKKDADFKLGTDVINDAFNNKILDAGARGKALIDLQARQAKENLTGKALIDAANEIVHPHVEHWYSNLLDKIADHGQGKQTQSTPIKSKSGKDMWKWSDGSYHYSPEKQ